MTTEANAQTQTAETPEATIAPVTAPAGGPATFTQEQVNAIVADRVARVKSAAPAAAPAPAPTAAPAGKVTLESLQAELHETRLRATFDKSAAKLNLAEEDADDLFENWRNKPADTRSGWLEAKAKRLMPATTTTPASTTTTNAVTNETRPAVAPNTPGRVNPVTSGGLVDIWNLSPDELSNLGPAGLRTEFEKLTNAANRLAGAPPRPKVTQR